MDLHDVDVILLLYYQYVIYFIESCHIPTPPFFSQKPGVIFSIIVRSNLFSTIMFHFGMTAMHGFATCGPEAEMTAEQHRKQPFLLALLHPERTALLASASAGGVFV